MMMRRRRRPQLAAVSAEVTVDKENVPPSCAHVLQSPTKMKDQERMPLTPASKWRVEQQQQTADVHLTDIFVKPGRKVGGHVLSVFSDHIRCKSRKGERIEIYYSNVKHAFYQLANRATDGTILLQFKLNEAVEVGSKEHCDVQFYCNTSRTTCKGLNSEFTTFIQAVEKFSNLKFEVTNRAMEFHAICHRSPAVFAPTQNCIVSFTQHPFSVVTLSEIELVYLERVRTEGSFDIVFVNKNYKKGVTMVESIPVPFLQPLKDMVSEFKIPIFSGPSSHKWKLIMQDIVENENWQPWGESGWRDLLQISDEDDEEDASGDDLMDDFGDDDDDDFCPVDGEDDEDHYISDEDVKTRRSKSKSRTCVETKKKKTKKEESRKRSRSPSTPLSARKRRRRSK